jgi:hypothetical protein
LRHFQINESSCAREEFLSRFEVVRLSAAVQQLLGS